MAVRLGEDGGWTWREGEFGGFVDGDDHVSGTSSTLYRAAILNDCDIAQGEFFYVNAQDGTMKKHPEWFSVQLGDLGVISTPSYPMMLQTPAIWRRLYSRHLLQSNGVRFNENFRRHDDLPFNIEVLTKSQQIAIVRRPVYYYLLGRDGQDVGATDERLFIHFRLFEYTRSRIGRRYWERDYFRKFTTMFALIYGLTERIEPRGKERYSEWDGHPNTLHAGTDRRAWQIENAPFAFPSASRACAAVCSPRISQSPSCDTAFRYRSGGAHPRLGNALSRQRTPVR
jgi:hypothetical protein